MTSVAFIIFPIYIYLYNFNQLYLNEPEKQYKQKYPASKKYIKCIRQMIYNKKTRVKYIMIKVGPLRIKQKRVDDRVIDLKIKRLRQELAEENFDLSDQNCNFLVNPNICVKNKFIALEIRAKPIEGLYSDIDFIITIFIQDHDYYKPPKIFNDRRIFHPNINPHTIQIIFSELVNWNPTNNINYILKRLKYTLVQPNGSIIPNNHLCKKAAYLYTIDRENFRNYIVQYCPMVIEGIVLRENVDTEMEDEEKDYQKYISIGQILPISRLKQYEEKTRNEEQFQFLNKRLNCMKLQSQSQCQSMSYFCFNQHQFSEMDNQ